VEKEIIFCQLMSGRAARHFHSARPCPKKPRPGPPGPKLGLKKSGPARLGPCVRVWIFIQNAPASANQIYSWFFQSVRCFSRIFVPMVFLLGVFFQSIRCIYSSVRFLEEWVIHTRSFVFACLSNYSGSSTRSKSEKTNQLGKQDTDR
jgi:hypothetical protein